jgi:hypothetical protein
MSQKAVPVADVSNLGWTPSSGDELYATMDEESSSEYSYIDIPPSGSFVVQLAKLIYPLNRQGHTLTVRIEASGGCAVAVIDLLQSDQLIASWSKKLTSGGGEYTFSLTEAEASKISRYDELQVRITAGGCTGCCAGGTAVVSLSGITSNEGTVPPCLCTGFNGEWQLQYDYFDVSWIQLKPNIISCLGSNSGTIKLQCAGSVMILNIYIGPDFLATYQADLADWDCKGTNAMSITDYASTLCQNMPTTISVVMNP